MADYATTKLAGQAESRADIALMMPNGDIVLIDTSVALPRAAASKVPGKAVVGSRADARVKAAPELQIVIATGRGTPKALQNILSHKAASL